MTRKKKDKDKKAASSKNHSNSPKSQGNSLKIDLEGLDSLGSLTISSRKGSPKYGKSQTSSSTGHSWEAVSTPPSCRYSEGGNATHSRAAAALHRSINVSNSSSCSSITTHSGGGGSPMRKTAPVKSNGDIPAYANVKSQKGKKTGKK